MRVNKICVIFVLAIFMMSGMGVGDISMLTTLYAAEAQGSSGSAQSDTLLDLYFNRIDSFYKQGNYRDAKNELNKVLMIDPTSPRAQQYARLIGKAENENVRAQQENYAEQVALTGAQQQVKSQREMHDAFSRMLQNRGELSAHQAYFDSNLQSHSEFDRLQQMGLTDYKKELMAEAKGYEKQKRWKLAAERYSDLLAIDPNDHEVREKLYKTQSKSDKEKHRFMTALEDIDDEAMLREVTRTSMGAEDYKRAMQGHGFAPSLKEPKPRIVQPLEKKIQVPVTADFRDVSIVSVLNFLADYTGINIIPSSMIIEEDRKVSVRFKNLPLEKALKYILKGQGLSYRLDEDVIWVATIDEMENEELVTRVFYLQKGSGVFTQFANATFSSLGTSGGAASVAGTQTVQDIIEEAVPFPPGAKIIYDQRLGVLIVTNTPKNLEKIAEILYIIDEPPQQILIESRFIDIDVTDKEAFGIDMDLDENLFLNNFPGTDSDQDFAFLPSSGWDFTGVVEGGDTTNGGSSLAFAGLLTAPEFQIFLNALSRNTKSKTLSAPKVTTVNNQTATIKVVTEEVFPTSFEVSLIQQDLNGDGDLDDAGETEFANVPQEFVSRDIGIILEVTPSVGMDHETITLSIIPEVSSVSATPAKFIRTEFDGSDEVSRGTGTPNLPRFTTSTLSTSVVLKSTETAVLGGLITESRSQTHEKVPFLGDLPAVGKLFRSDQDTIQRRNLVIFITASVLN